jgi:predicted transposase YbfD/YdcC
MESSIPATLLAAFATVPDPRRRQGTRYALSAVLALMVAAMLANHRSVLAIAEWGASQDDALLAALGFPAGVTPHQSTVQRLVRRLDVQAVSAAVGRYLTQRNAPSTARGQQGIALDGKAQRTRQAYAEPATGVIQALSAVCHDSGIVLAQEPVEHLGDKAEAELTVAPRLLARLDLRDRVVTGDALYCQRELCQQVLAAGGDYLFLVKANQPALYEDLRLLFDPPTPALPLLDQRAVCTLDQGHGRYDETRHLIASTDLNEYLDWPGVQQVFRLKRTWWHREWAPLRQRWQSRRRSLYRSARRRPHHPRHRPRHRRQPPACGGLLHHCRAPPPLQSPPL